MSEKLCKLRIVAITNEGKRVIGCNGKGCLREKVWKAMGIKPTAAQNLETSEENILLATREGDCAEFDNS